MQPFDDLARFYDVDHIDVTDDIGTYQHFALQVGSPVLELGCGTGRLTLPLARKGHEVIAVDVSPAMLARLRAKLAEEESEVAERVRPVLTDMRQLDLGEEVPLAIIPFNTFMHLLTKEDQEVALGKVHLHLSPGGMLVVDIASPYLFLLATAGEAMTLQRELHDPETNRTIQKFISTQFDHANQIQRLLIVYDEVAEDKTVKRWAIPVNLRYVFRFEMELLLERAGFHMERVYGSVDLDPLGLDSERMIFVARK